MRRYVSRRKRIIRRLCVFVILLSAAAIVLTYVINNRLRPIVEIMAQSKLQDIATDIVNEVAYNVMQDSTLTYESLVLLEKSDGNAVTALRVDTVRLNAVKSYITLEVNKRVNALTDVCVEVPVGSLTSLEFLTATGPAVTVHVLPVGSTYATVHQEFTQAGINQVRHRIYVRVTVEADLIFPTSTRNMEYHSDFVIAETVIVGISPDTYADLTDAMSYIDEKNILAEDEYNG